MDSLLSSTDLSSSKAANFASGILSSLGSLFGANAAGASLFASLLSEEQASTPVTPPPPQVTSPSTSTQNSAPQENDNSDEGSTNDPASIGALKSLIFVLHRVIDKLHRRESGEETSNNSQADSANTGTPATTDGTSQAPPATTTGNAADTPSFGNDNGTSGPKTLADILSDLTDLMRLMEKKLEAAQGANGDPTTQTSDAGDSTSNSTNTGAPDPLTQLLSLMQLIQQQLTSTAGGTSPTATTATSDGATAPGNTSPVLTALQDLLQIQKDLKGLMASLQNGSANGDPTATGGTPSTGANAPGATTNNLPQTAIDTTTSNKPSLASQDSFFGLFGGPFTNPFASAPTTNAFSPVNTNTPIAGADAVGGVSPDTSGTGTPDNGSLSSDGGSANLNGLNANAAAFSGPADGGKSVDPYAFASQLSAARATNGGMTGLPDVVEQVLLQLNRGAKDGNDQMTIQLHPAELGKINVKLDISSDGRVQGTVVASNPTTLNLLLKDVRGLERALQEAGLRADPGSLQFSMSGQSGNQSEQTANNSTPNTSSGDTGSSGTTGTAIDIPATTDETYYLTPGRVNLKV